MSLIDIVAKKNNLMTVSDFSTVSDGVASSSSLPKPGFFWTIGHDGGDEFLLFDGIVPFMLREIVLQVTAVSAEYRLEYSSDGLVWDEFPWKIFGGTYYKVTDRFAVYRLINEILPDTSANRNYLTKSGVVGATGCRILYLSSYDAQSFNEDQVFTRMLKFYISGNFTTFEILNEKLLIQGSGTTETEISTVLQHGRYAFTDDSGNYFYPNGVVTTQLRLYLKSFTTNYNTPLSVSEFAVMSEETLSEDYTLFSLTSDNFYSQKFFEEFPFLPDMVNTFMMMLEERPAETAENIDLISTFEITAKEE